MPWKNRLLEWLKHGNDQLRYVLVGITVPIPEDDFRQIASCWRTSTHHHILATLHSRPDEKARFLRDNQWDEVAFARALQATDLQLFKHFPFVGLLTDDAGLELLRKSKVARHLYEPPKTYNLDYVSILLGLHKTLEYALESRGANPPADGFVACMSLGPPEPYPFLAEEPVNIATRILSEHGIVVCVAAGNSGPENNTLNPWSVAPWVIGVGAAYYGGQRLYEKSSRGVPGSALYRPTVVAPGVEVPTLRGNFPGEVVDPTGRFALVTGSSFANALVVGIAATCCDWLGKLACSPQLAECRAVAEKEMKIRLLEIAPTTEVLKRLITNMAVVMPGYGPHEVGAGFVDDDIAAKFLLEDFSLAHFIKVFEDNGVVRKM